MTLSELVREDVFLSLISSALLILVGYWSSLPIDKLFSLPLTVALDLNQVDLIPLFSLIDDVFEKRGVLWNLMIRSST